MARQGPPLIRGGQLIKSYPEASLSPKIKKEVNRAKISRKNQAYDCFSPEYSLVNKIKGIF